MRWCPVCCQWWLALIKGGPGGAVISWPLPTCGPPPPSQTLRLGEVIKAEGVIKKQE